MSQYYSDQAIVELNARESNSVSCVPAQIHRDNSPIIRKKKSEKSSDSSKRTISKPKLRKTQTVFSQLSRRLFLAHQGKPASPNALRASTDSDSV